MKRYVGKALFIIALGMQFSCNAVAATAPLAIAAVEATPAGVGVGGTMTVTVTGGVPPYTFSLNGIDVPSQPQMSPTVTVNRLASQTQAINVTDSATPQNATEVDLLITDGTTIMVSGITVKQPSCFGGTNGSLNFSTIGGSGDITYDLTNRSGFAARQINDGLFTNLVANSEYTIVVSSAGSGALGQADIPLAQPFALGLTISSVTNQDIINSTLGSIVAMVSGGTPPYTLTLTPGGQAPQTGTATQTVFTFNNLVANTYKVTAVDANGCTVSDPAVVLCVRGTSTNPITNFITTALCNGGCVTPTT